jgi:hypothetical protein
MNEGQFILVMTAGAKDKHLNGWKYSMEGGLVLTSSGRPLTVKYVEIKDQMDQRLRQPKNVLMKLNLKLECHAKKQCQNGLKANRKCYSYEMATLKDR